MTRRASAPRGELGVMKLKGRQILVLDTEYLIAIDVQNSLSRRAQRSRQETSASTATAISIAS